MRRPVTRYSTLVVLLALVYWSFQVTAGPPGPAGNGDVNGDGTYDVSDPIYLLEFLFNGGAVPVPLQGAGAPPLGAVIDWWRPDSSFPMPTDYWVTDGSSIADPQSPFDGAATPDLDGRFVVGANSVVDIGLLGGELTHTHDFGHSHAGSAQTAAAGDNHAHAWATNVDTGTNTHSWFGAAGGSFTGLSDQGTVGSGYYPLAVPDTSPTATFITSDGGPHTHGSFASTTSYVESTQLTVATEPSHIELLKLVRYLPPGAIINGDVDADGTIGLGDVIYLLNYLFDGGTAPVPIDNTPPPLGTVVEWWRPNSSFAVPEGYALCDGTLLDDAESPFDGVAIPDLLQRYSKGTTDLATIGSVGGSDTHSHVVEHFHDYQGNTVAGGGHSHVWASFNASTLVWASGDGTVLFDYGNGVSNDGAGEYPLARSDNTGGGSWSTSASGSHDHGAASGVTDVAATMPTGTNDPRFVGLAKLVRTRTDKTQTQVGMIFDWWRPSSMFSVPEGYQVCDGSMVDDAASPYFGTTLPDLRSQFVKGFQLGGIGMAGGNLTHNHGHPHTHSPTTTSSGGATNVFDTHSHDGPFYDSSMKRWYAHPIVSPLFPPPSVFTWTNGLDAMGTPDTRPLYATDSTGDVTMVTSASQPAGSHNHAVDVAWIGGTPSLTPNVMNSPPHVQLLKIMRIR